MPAILFRRSSRVILPRGEDGSTYLASNVLDPAAKAQQPAHTDFSPAVWEWDADAEAQAFLDDWATPEPLSH